jgi:hypothetical protein
MLWALALHARGPVTLQASRGRTAVVSWYALAQCPAAFIALFDWRKGLVAMIIVAFLQDPARSRTRPAGLFHPAGRRRLRVIHARAQISTRFL